MKLTILERPTELTAKDFKVRLEKKLELLKGELTASLAVVGFSTSGWAQVNITGADSEIVAHLVSNKFGTAVTALREIQSPGVYPAVIETSNERGLKFDVGLGAELLDCTIPTRTLLVQLADGKTIRLRQLFECYSLYPGVRISVRFTGKGDSGIEYWLSDEYLDHLSRWVKSGLDRILAFDCYLEDAESAVLNAHLTRDVVAIEPVTLSLQTVVCKLGTDAVGLIPKLGRILRRHKLTPFQPKKIEKICRSW